MWMYVCPYVCIVVVMQNVFLTAGHSKKYWMLLAYGLISKLISICWLLIVHLVLDYLPAFILHCSSRLRTTLWPTVFQMCHNMSCLCIFFFLQALVFFLLHLPIKFLSVFNIHLICNPHCEVFSNSPLPPPPCKADHPFLLHDNSGPHILNLSLFYHICLS